MCQLENSKHHDKLLWEECKQFLWRSKLHHSWKWVCCRLSLSHSTLRLEFLTFVHKWSGLFCIPNILNMIYCPTAHMGPSMYYVIKNWGFLTWRLPDNRLLPDNWLKTTWKLPDDCLTTMQDMTKWWAYKAAPLQIYTVFNCVPLSTSISLYGLHLIAIYSPM